MPKSWPNVNQNPLLPRLLDFRTLSTVTCTKLGEYTLEKRCCMNKRLSQDQLAQVVAEIEQLKQRREDELDREQVQQILQELNLPDDLLDDALVQVSRRQALEVQQRRNRWIVAGVTAVLVGAIATTTFFIQNRQQALNQVSVYQSRITLTQDSGSNLTTIERQTSPRVYYRVTLNDAPVGEKLSLNCDWIDPNGQVAHQSRYTTTEIDKSAWSTYCYYQLNPGLVTGTWNVQISLGERTLNSSSFVVK